MSSFGEGNCHFFLARRLFLSFLKEMAAPRDRFIPTLDGWRALAILGVLACHWCKDPHSISPALPWLRILLEKGSFGVDLFFAISGYLITTRLLLEAERTGKISIRDFYLRRAFRILPASWAYLSILSLLVGVGWLSVPWREILSCLFFFRNYLPFQVVFDENWYTGHFWSLAVEEHFYFLWPLLLSLAGKKMLHYTPFLALLIAGWRLMAAHIGFLHFLPQVSFLARTDIRLDSLFWGSWFALLMDSGALSLWFRHKMSKTVWVAVVLAASAFVFLSLPFAGLFVPILLGVMVAGTVTHSDWGVSKVLEKPALTWIGRISYSLYLWHMLWIVPPSHQGGPLAIFQDYRWNIFLTLGVASLSYYWIERPFIALGVRLQKRSLVQATPIAQ